MGLFWRAAGGILIAAVLVLAVGRQEKDLALLLNMAACVVTLVTVLSFLEPVLDFLQELDRQSGLQSGVLGNLLKIAGIGLVSEMAGMICQDSGNSSLARTMQMLGTAVILSLSVPIFETLLTLVEEILEKL